VDPEIRVGDVVVSRVNGQPDIYAIGRIVAHPTQGQAFEAIAPITKTRDAAVRRGYENATGKQRVWLFDGNDAADKSYSEAPRP